MSVRPPNIVFVIMDDTGFGDTECYGHTAMRTPATKRVAAKGVTFTRMYTAPTGSPGLSPSCRTGCGRLTSRCARSTSNPNGGPDR